MDVKVFEKEKSTIELIIEITPEELAPYRKKAIAKLAGQVEIAGFRKGKAPLNLVEPKLEPTKILEEMANQAIPQMYGRVVLEKKLEPIGSPQIEIQKFAPGNPLVFKATVAVLPNFKLPDYSKIKVEHKEVKVEEDEVGKLLRRLQKDHAVEKPVTRPAAKGDAIEVDFDIFQDKVPIENGQGRGRPLIIGENVFIPGFEDQLVGLKKDQEKSFTLKFPPDYRQKSVAGKVARFKVKMLSVKERTLPELDDKFAAQVGKFKDLADLKKQLKENLLSDHKAREDQRFEGEVLNKLAEQTNVEMPGVLLQGELDKMGRELERSLINQGANLKDYLISINKTLEQLKKGWIEQAKKRVTIGLLLRGIAKKESIDVSEEELEDELNATLKQNPGNVEVIKAVKKPAYKDYVKEVIRNRKIIKLVSSLAEKNN